MDRAQMDALAHIILKQCDLYIAGAAAKMSDSFMQQAAHAIVMLGDKLRIAADLQLRG